MDPIVDATLVEAVITELRELLLLPERYKLSELPQVDSLKRYSYLQLFINIRNVNKQSVNQSVVYKTESPVTSTFDNIKGSQLKPKPTTFLQNFGNLIASIGIHHIIESDLDSLGQYFKISRGQRSTIKTGSSFINFLQASRGLNVNNIAPLYDALTVINNNEGKQLILTYYDVN